MNEDNLEEELFNELESETSSYQEIEYDEPEYTQEESEEDAEQGADAGIFLSAPLVVSVADMALSRLGSIGSTWAGVPASIKDYQLTAEERRELEPIVEAWLEFENFAMNPRVALITSVVMLYAGKFVIAKQSFAEKKKAGETIEEVKKEKRTNRGGRPKGAKDTAPRKPRADKGQKKAPNEAKNESGPKPPEAV